jgi:hypothetical protein
MNSQRIKKNKVTEITSSDVDIDLQKIEDENKALKKLLTRFSTIDPKDKKGKKTTFWLTLALLFTMLGKIGYAGEPFKKVQDKPIVRSLTGSRNGPVLYDQMLPLSYGSIVSQEMTDAGSAPLSSVAADDFIVPEGDNWDVHYVNVAGSYFSYAGASVTGMNVVFYDNNNGMPGNAVHSFSNITTFNELPIDVTTGLYLYEITLPSAVALSAGHYWMSVQAVSNYTVTGQWGWFTHESLVIDEQYEWKNPGDGFGLGFTDWTPASMVTWGSYNLAFSLSGPGEDGDLSVSAIIQPVTGAGLTNAEIISANVKNEGTSVLSGFNMKYSINGGAAITENTGSFTLNANQTATYNFTTPGNFSVPGPYEITVFAANAADPNHANDTSKKTVYNLGTIYPMVETGSQTITTCGATFTDAGGLEGMIGMDDNAVTTIFPANPGDRVRLTFLEFNASYGGFEIFNGIDTTASLMGNWMGTDSPGQITALNSSGALTIRFHGPGWEQTSGWVAYISCVTPMNDEFEMTSFDGSLTTLFEGNTMTMTANVKNLGTGAFDKPVTFKVNGNVIGVQQTRTLNSFDTTLVSMTWVAPSPGVYTFQASLPADGDNLNNSLSFERTVLAYNAFFEDFENEEFPPANWHHGGFWARSSNNPAGGSYNATSAFSNTQSDTLVSCRVDVGNDPVLHFYAKTSMWWKGNMDLYFFTESNSTWNFVQNIPLPIMTYEGFDVDMSAFSGERGRVGFFVNVTDPFSWSGMVDLDLISGENITVHFDDYDLKSKSFTGSQYYTTSEPATFNFKIQNIGTEAVLAGSYRVALCSGEGNGTELFSVPGNAISPLEEQTYELPYTFNELDQFPVFSKIVFVDDQYNGNNLSDKIYVTGVADSSKIVVVGETVGLNEAPVIFSFKNSLTESLYLNEDINREGVIFGIRYKYNFASDETSTPIKIWMGSTTQGDMLTWVPASELTLVFDGTVNFLKEAGSVYIPFQVPYNYADTSLNLVIMVQKIDDHTTINQNFSNYGTVIMSTLLAASNDEAPDPNAPPEAGQAGMNPSIDLIFNDNIGTASGFVHDVTAQPVEGTKVWIGPLNITSWSDASGNYNIPYVPAGTYNTTAEKFGYQNNQQPLAITNGNNTVLDFEMLTLDMVSVTGFVEGNDNPGTGIANAVVNLVGYANFSTTTDEQGFFTFNGVYVADNYLLTINANNYDLYNDTINVEGALNVGTISLTESMNIARVVIATTDTTSASISWNEPSASASTVIAFDDGENEDGYAGEPAEAVWLGNYLQIPEPVTITSFDLYWAKYGTSIPQSHRLDIFELNGQLVYSSDEFMSVDNGWVRVDIPNITFNGKYYIMVYWENTPVQSNYLGIDTASVTTPNNAYYHYEGGDFFKLSTLTFFSGTFLIHTNVLTSDPAERFDDNVSNSSREINGYNISFGRFNDIENAENWPVLNSTMLTETSYLDETWPPAEVDRYIYGVKTKFTTGESEFSFSSILNYDPVNTQNIDIPGIKLYPNPATESLTIETVPGSELMVFNMQGTLLFKDNIKTNEYKLNVTGLSKGTILIVLKSGNILSQQKVVIN